MNDIGDLLAFKPIERKVLFELYKDLRIARVQLNVNPNVEYVTVDGYLQIVDRDNVSHLIAMAENRCHIYGGPPRVDGFQTA